MSMSGNTGKPKIDKEYLKKLAEKIKAERQKKQQETSETEEPQQKPEEKKSPGTPPETPPEPPSQPPTDAFGEVEEEEEMAAEKTAIIDLASLSGQSAKAKLTLLDGKNEGKTVDISREEMFAGRSLDNDFVISDISISRKHFKITCEDDIYYVTDLGSGNGIRVNGEKTDRARLYHNDTIVAGARHIRFEVIDEKLLEMNSRKSTPETNEKSAVVKSGEKSALPWIAAIVFIFIGIAAAGVYFYPNIENTFFASEPAQTPAMKELDKTMSKLESSAIDFEKRKELLEKADKIISTMSREERENPDVKKHTESVNRSLKEANDFLIAQKLNELAEKENMDEKAAEAVEKFKELPKDSIFFQDIISELGKNTVFGWSAEKIENIIEKKKHKKAAAELSRLKKAYPDYEKIPELEKKLAEIKPEEKTPEPEKKKEKKAASEIKPEKSKPAAAPSSKKTSVASKKVAPEKKKPAPSEPSFSRKDINKALSLFESKKFNDSYKLFVKIAKSNADTEIKKQAVDYAKQIKAFVAYHKYAVRGSRKNLRKALEFDKKISGGELRKYLVGQYRSAVRRRRQAASRKKSKSSPRTTSSRKEVSQADMEKVKKLYMQGRISKDASKFREIMEILPPGHDFYKKAKAALDSL